MFILFSLVSGRLWSTVQNALFWWSLAYSQLNLSMATHWGQAGSEAGTQASCPSESSKGAESKEDRPMALMLFLEWMGDPVEEQRMKIFFIENENSAQTLTLGTSWAHYQRSICAAASGSSCLATFWSCVDQFECQ